MKWSLLCRGRVPRLQSATSTALLFKAWSDNTRQNFPSFSFKQRSWHLFLLPLPSDPRLPRRVESGCSILLHDPRRYPLHLRIPMFFLGYVASFGLVAPLASAGGAYERYNPYPYITSTPPTNKTIVSVTPPEATDDVYYVANAFYANYHNKSFTIDDIEWNKITSITYGSIPIPEDSFSNITLTLKDAEAISKLVTKADSLNLTTLISFGGTDGSAGFASALASPNTTAEFISGIKRVLSETGVGGVEFNWEYSECSPETPYTSEVLSSSFLELLKGLRAEVSNDTLITVAAGPLPFVTPSLTIPSGNETTNGTVADGASNSTSVISVDVDAAPSNVSTTFAGSFHNLTRFAEVVDYFTILAFDLSGPWSESGVVQPGAPLNGTCNLHNDTLSISVTSAVASWLLSGVRADQIVLGVSAVGRSYRVPTASAMQTNSTLTVSPEFSLLPSNSSTDLGDSWWLASSNKTVSSSSSCNSTTNTTQLSTSSGVFSFQGLVDAGFLCKKGKVQKSKDVVAGYDECSQTAFVYKKHTEVMVSYENARSFKAKGQFVFDANLRGFSFYEAAADSSAILLDAIRAGAGFEPEETCGPDEEIVWLPTHPDDPDDPEDDDDLTEWVTVKWTDILRNSTLQTGQARK